MGQITYALKSDGISCPMFTKTHWSKEYFDNFDRIFGPKCSSCNSPCDESGHSGLDGTHTGICCGCYEKDEGKLHSDFIEFCDGQADAKLGNPPSKLSGQYFDGYKSCYSTS